MAVYTHISAEDVSALLLKYDVGTLIALKGIAEGVQNSNFFVETTKGRYFLTLYETSIDPNDLPFFHDMLGHLHRAGCRVPSFIDDRNGNWLQNVAGRPACLIEFLSGISLSEPNAEQSFAVGAALGEVHSALSTFDRNRPNILGVDSWLALAKKCDGDALEEILPGLSDRIVSECAFLSENWPRHLPQSVIHADLFPDNVLTLGNDISGLIDFYFACTDITAFDLAITHAAWSFSPNGKIYHPHIGSALCRGYLQSHGLSLEEMDAMPILLRGASMRFLLTRCYDWINTPANALVTRKDPLAFLARLDFYADNANHKTILNTTI